MSRWYVDDKFRWVEELYEYLQKLWLSRGGTTYSEMSPREISYSQFTSRLEWACSRFLDLLYCFKKMYETKSTKSERQYYKKEIKYRIQRVETEIKMAENFSEIYQSFIRGQRFLVLEQKITLPVISK